MTGHAFISYARGDDGRYVRELADHLTAAGVSVWFDVEIDVGDRWEQVVRERIDTCAAFLVVMTPRADQSAWVSREIDQAEQSARPILPLLLAGQRFFRLADIQFEDVRDGRLPSSRFVDHLRTLLGRSANDGVGPTSPPGHQGGVDVGASRPGRRSGPVLVGSMPLAAGFFQHRLVARELEQAIRPGQTAVLSQVLTGLGGVGKTQLAADYARRAWRGNEVDLMVWVTATSREAVISRYAEAADAVEGGHRDVAERAAQRFLRWIATQTGSRWLVVLDDLAKPGLLDGLWPPTGTSGRTIVTTRRRDAVLASQGRRLVEVGMFTEAEARGYLSAALAEYRGLADDVDGLAADLGYLPLALSHAAAFMIDRRLNCSTYRDRFRDQRRHLAELFPEPEAIPDQYQQTVATTWSLSIDVADTLRPAGMARPVIEMASVLDPNGTPDAVFRSEAARDWMAANRGQGLAGAPVDDAEARDGLYCLQRLNLAAVNEGMVRVHALVQRAVCEMLGPRIGALRRAAVMALDQAWAADPTLGWQLLSTMVKIAAEVGDEALLRRIFNQLLAMLDGRASETLMHRAWDASYVIEDNFTIVLPYILEALDGQPLEVVAGREPTASHLGAPARITQAAASSLAATFVAMDDPAAGDPGHAIPILSRGLSRWNLRKRFVDALTRYRDPRALAEVIAFTQRELTADTDIGLLGGLATAIGTLGQVVDAHDRAPAIALLEAIAAHDGIDIKTMRIARTSIAVLEERPGDIPEVSDEEIIECLNPSSYRGSYPDWIDVRDAADHAYRRVLSGSYPAEMVTALLHAFGHPISRVRPPVARCLGMIDEARARASLLAELLKPDPPADVRNACLHAFSDQIRMSASPTIGALRRWQALDAAARSATPDADLMQLAHPYGADELRVTRGAFETLRAHVLVIETTIVDDAAPVDAPRDIVGEADIAAVGPDMEEKYRIRSVSLTQPNTLSVTVAPTTWTIGASFHRALTRQGPLSIEDLDRLLTDLLSGADLPGIASVHCIVVTGDDKVVQTRRPDTTPYSPGLWSVSFEEQLTTADFTTTEDPFRAAARRGLIEELGVDGQNAAVTIHSAVVEVPVLNRGLVAIVRTPITSADVKRVWSERSPLESSAVYCVDAIPELLRAEAQRPNLHPTAALRLLTLADVVESGPLS